MNIIIFNFFSSVFHLAFAFSTFIPQNYEGYNFFLNIIEDTTIKVLIIVYNYTLEPNCEEKVKHFKRRRRNARLAVSLQAPWRRVIPPCTVGGPENALLVCSKTRSEHRSERSNIKIQNHGLILSSHWTVKTEILKGIATLSLKLPVWGRDFVLLFNPQYLTCGQVFCTAQLQ